MIFKLCKNLIILVIFRDSQVRVLVKKVFEEEDFSLKDLKVVKFKREKAKKKINLKLRGLREVS